VTFAERLRDFRCGWRRFRAFAASASSGTLGRPGRREAGHRHRHPPPLSRDVHFATWACSSSMRSSGSGSRTRSAQGDALTGGCAHPHRTPIRAPCSGHEWHARDLDHCDPPADRLAIRTFVCGFDPDFCAKRLPRNWRGEVRCSSCTTGWKICQVDSASVRPGARSARGHGPRQMPRPNWNRYDRLCRWALRHLVLQTIIESGLDIPAPNTMIVNHADRYGLAQLYQLRGRIGRAKERASATW